jgi:hypothetical protein
MLLCQTGRTYFGGGCSVLSELDRNQRTPCIFDLQHPLLLFLEAIMAVLFREWAEIVTNCLPKVQTQAAVHFLPQYQENGRNRVRIVDQAEAWRAVYSYPSFCPGDKAKDVKYHQPHRRQCSTRTAIKPNMHTAPSHDRE